MQVFSDGPNNKDNVLETVYMLACSQAKKEILIATPYLILSREFLSVLKLAAVRGVKVKILIPGQPDKKYVYRTTQSFIEELLEAGAEVYSYRDTFVHSKTMVIDKKLAVIGTTNFDTRSFKLNFEVSAVIYGGDIIDRFIEDFHDDFSNSLKYEYISWKNRGFMKKLSEKLTSLASPLF